ncbi:FAD/NAD(P)-binding domain-containing protein [Ramaria rubella]|nr:FAD/NAD(P)-binding domain-containing protein [Ramaria rubella]
MFISLLHLLSLVLLVLSNAQYHLDVGAVHHGSDPYLFPSSDSEHHCFTSQINSVAVIGAGPAGLQHAATLLQHGFQVRLFERDTVPGGNWRYTDETPIDVDYSDKPLPIAGYQPDIPPVLPFSKTFKDGEGGYSLSNRFKEHWLPRPIWNSLSTNSPAAITHLPNINYDEGSPWVLSNHQIQRHVRQYASAHALSPIDDTEHPNATSYGTRVERLRKTNHSNNSEAAKWQLTLRKLTRFVSDVNGLPGIRADWWTEEFDAVVVAAGQYDAPHVPEIKGLPEIAQNSTQIYHSRNYRRPQDLSGKNVLIVGSSVSASEISRDLIGHVKSLTVSARQHDGWKHPFKIRSLARIPQNVSIVPEISEFRSLNEIHLINGTILSGIEEVILATGFLRSYPFLADYHNSTFTGKPYDFDVAPILTDGKSLNSLSFSGHYIEDPTLAFSSVRPWTLGTLQALAFAKVWEGTARLPTRTALWDEYYSRNLKDQPHRPGSGLFGTSSAEGSYRRFVTWINTESYLHGGRLVNYYPLNDREVFINFAGSNGLAGYLTHENFTRADATPAHHYLRGLERGNEERGVTWNDAVWDDLNW